MPNVKLAGAVAFQPHTAELLFSARQYPVTATLSVAVKVVTGTIRLPDVAGMVKAVTDGAAVSVNVPATV